MSESVVFCEGYHDRAFWAGWLEHLGCENLGRPRGRSGRIQVRDPWENLVAGGEFAFRSRTGEFLRIVPCQGKERVLAAAESRLKDRELRRLVRLAVNVDSDKNADGTSAAQSALSYQALESRLRKLGEPTKDKHGDFALDDGATIVSVVRWEASDTPAASLPNQQTLERLVCAAVVAAHPNRGPAVQGWLDSRQDGPPAGPKEFAWSHMAGWYAEQGCEAFYRIVWTDPKVVSELESRLRQCGAWRIAEALAE